MCSAIVGHPKHQLIHLTLHQQKRTTLSEWISMCLFHEWQLWFETKYGNESAESIDFVTVKYPLKVTHQLMHFQYNNIFV